MRVDIFKNWFLVILISVLTLCTIQTFAGMIMKNTSGYFHMFLNILARLRDGRFHRFPTTKNPSFVGHDGNNQHVHPLVELEEGHNVQHATNQRRMLPANHLKKKRTYKVVFFDSQGDSIHLSSEMVKEIEEEVQIDPENRASNHQSTSDAASTSEEAPEIEITIPVPELIEQAQNWGFHSAEHE